MDIHFEQVFVRPDTNVPWFHETFTPSHITYVKDTYIDTGLVSVDKTLSVDELTLTIVYGFLDSNAYDTWTNDPTMQASAAQKVAYNVANGISQTA
jgi:hypothetical protein